MALKKKIKKPNGIELDYHKIALITIEPNEQITILRHSYLNEEARQYEKDFRSGKKRDGKFEPPYMDYEYIGIPYSENINDLIGAPMECGYKLLKKHRPEFADAEDLL